LTLSIAAVSCLKDKAYDNGTIQSGSQGSGQDTKVISLGITVSSTSNFLQASFQITGSDTTVDLIPVELGGTSDAPADIHVTLTVDDSLLEAYNNANGTNFVDASSVATILNNGVVTIPKGSRIGYLQVTFNASNLLAENYALPVKITSVAEPGYTISGNLNTGIVAIGPKNQYDGMYELTILTSGWGAYGINDGPPALTWPTNVGLVTSGPNSVVFSSEVGSSQPAFAGGGITGFGATEPQFTFDPTTNKLISVVNLVPDDGRGRTFFLNPAVTDSRYDPATQTIYAAYEMTQNGRPNQFIYDTLVYRGPR
jgi:hypothetical protein